MNCLPYETESERDIVEPFVQCLNILEGKHYCFHSIPDEKNRSSPSPDGLYEDSVSSERLVIERKSIVYPKYYAKRHKTDHDMMEIIFSRVPIEVRNGPYILEIGYQHEGIYSVLMDHAEKLSLAIGTALPKVRNGGQICFKVDGWEYEFRHKTAHDQDDMTPWDTLVLCFGHNQPRLSPLLSPLSDFLVDEFRGIFTVLPKKFSGYADCRRILLINRFGDARRTTPRAWRTFFANYNATIPADEIWDSWIETPDYSVDSYWICDRFWPCDDFTKNPAEDIWIPCAYRACQENPD